MDLSDILVGLTRTFGLVALIAAGFGWAIAATDRGFSRGIVIGLLFSVGGLMSMSDPIVLAPGVIIDGRTAVIALAFPFAGVIGSAIVCITLTTYRIWIGGAGVWSGVVGIMITALVTIAFWHFSRKRIRDGIARNALLALASSTSLLSIFLLPGTLPEEVLRTAALPMVAANTIGILVLSQFLVREKQRLRLLRALEHDAAVDPLTKLVNRRVFDRIAQSAERRAQAGAEGFSMVMIDVDNFKRVNDTRGHQAGDEILRRIAAMVRDMMRRSDVVARYGGEEIVVLMPNTPLAVAAGVAERMRECVEREFDVLGQERITVSAGIASFAAHAPTLGDVMREADRALYQAKRDGRNRVGVDARNADAEALAA